MKNIEDNQIINNKPDNFAFIIGAMKSGTTSLFEILSQHPEVCPSKIKEPDYFTKDSTDSSHEDYLSLWNWQDQLHSIALESSVAYSKAPFITGTARRIHDANLGKCRFIYMLRNPLARIESQVRHGLFAGWGKSLDDGIPEDAVNFSSYAMQLDNYLNYFSGDDILLITLEEFIDSPDSVLSRICQFLNIDRNFEFEDIKTTRNSGDFFNTSVGLSTLTQSNLGQFIAHKLLSQKNKTLLRTWLSRLGKGKKANTDMGRWKLTPEEKNHVLNILADDLKRLESKYKVDIKKYWQIETELLDKNQSE